MMKIVRKPSEHPNSQTPATESAASNRTSDDKERVQAALDKANKKYGRALKRVGR
jgi:hypothetical protein